MPIYRVTPDTDPQSLVGMYVVRKADSVFGAVTDPRQVVATRGRVLQVMSVPRYWSEAATRWMVGEKEGSSMQQQAQSRPPVPLRSVYMACDSLNALETLLEYSHAVEKQFVQFCQSSKDGLHHLADGPVPLPGQEDGDSRDWPKVSYRNASAGDDDTRFVSYARDRLPAWAVDVRPHRTDREELAALDTGEALDGPTRRP